MSLDKTLRKKSKCRLVKGKKETCCINPKKGHWCWSNERSVSKNASKKLAKTMKKQCCKK